MSNLQKEIGSLSNEEKFELLDLLWESLETATPALTDEQRSELDCRIPGTDSTLRILFRGSKSQQACLESSDASGCPDA